MLRKRSVERKQAIKLHRAYLMIINSATEQSHSEADSHTGSQTFSHFFRNGEMFTCCPVTDNALWVLLHQKSTFLNTDSTNSVQATAILIMIKKVTNKIQLHRLIDYS